LLAEEFFFFGAIFAGGVEFVAWPGRRDGDFLCVDVAVTSAMALIFSST